jgi:hypothetical protein
MRVLFAVAVLALLVPQMQPIPQDDSGLKLVQLSFEKKWVEHDRLSGGMVSNQPPVLNNSTIMLPESTKGENPVITRQQEKARVSNASRSAIKVKRNDAVIAPWGWVYNFRAEIKNDRSRAVTSFVWAYRLPPSSIGAQDAPDQEYLCNVRIEPGETKRIKVVSPIPRTRVVNASTAGTPPADQPPSVQDMIINQIKFADGDTWQRLDWNGIILLTRAKVAKLNKGKCMAL